jgi:hypothetical protein
MLNHFYIQGWWNLLDDLLAIRGWWLSCGTKHDRQFSAGLDGRYCKERIPRASSQSQQSAFCTIPTTIHAKQANTKVAKGNHNASRGAPKQKAAVIARVTRLYWPSCIFSFL